MFQPFFAPSCPAPHRLVLVAALVTLALAGCGRRGALEPPPDPNAPRAQETQAAQPGAIAANPVGRPRRTDSGPLVPKDPFILDPLL